MSGNGCHAGKKCIESERFHDVIPLQSVCIVELNSHRISPQSICIYTLVDLRKAIHDVLLVSSDGSRISRIESAMVDEVLKDDPSTMLHAR